VFTGDEDARLQPGAYISHAGSLYEVVGLDNDCLRVLNCTTATDRPVTFGVLFVITHFTLEKRAPAVPDHYIEQAA
jgi:hypothetical protein